MSKLSVIIEFLHFFLLFYCQIVFSFDVGFISPVDCKKDDNIADNDADQRQEVDEEEEREVVDFIYCLGVKSMEFKMWFSINDCQLRDELKSKFRGTLVEVSVRMLQQPCQ